METTGSALRDSGAGCAAHTTQTPTRLRRQRAGRRPMAPEPRRLLPTAPQSMPSQALGSEEPALRERHAPVAPDHDVVEHAHVDERERSDEHRSAVALGVVRLHAAPGIAAHRDERGGIVGERTPCDAAQLRGGRVGEVPLGRPPRRNAHRSQDSPGARGRTYPTRTRRHVGREPGACARISRARGARRPRRHRHWPTGHAPEGHPRVGPPTGPDSAAAEAAFTRRGDAPRSAAAPLGRPIPL